MPTDRIALIYDKDWNLTMIGKMPAESYNPNANLRDIIDHIWTNKVQSKELGKALIFDVGVEMQYQGSIKSMQYVGNKHEIVFHNATFSEVKPEPNIKPPLGVIPRRLFLESRLEELKRAITDYAKEGLPIFQAWTIEYNDILEQLAKMDESEKKSE